MHNTKIYLRKFFRVEGKKKKRLSKISFHEIFTSCGMIRTLQLFFNPHSSRTLIDVIRTSETVKSEALSVTRLQLMQTAVLYPGAGLAATPASTPTPPHLSILQVEVSLLHRNTLVSAIMVYAIKCHACHKIYIGETGRHLGDRFREPVYAPEGYHTPIILLDAILLPRGTQLRTYWFL